MTRLRVALAVAFLLFFTTIVECNTLDDVGENLLEHIKEFGEDVAHKYKDSWTFLHVNTFCENVL